MGQHWDEFVDSGEVTEQARLALLEHIFDPISIRNLLQRPGPCRLRLADRDSLGPTDLSLPQGET
jgi:hypothetical protein